MSGRNLNSISDFFFKNGVEIKYISNDISKVITMDM